jgi:hypothetical protein
MNMTIKYAIGCCILLAFPATYACDYPKRPTIPDGSSASKDELMLAKEDVNTYLAGVDDYLTCIETDEKAAVAALEDPKPAELKRRDEVLEKKFDAANDEKALVGEQFNLQVRAYNAARKTAE